MSDRRRGLGRGLGALIPSGPQTIHPAERPVDLLFKDRDHASSPVLSALVSAATAPPDRSVTVPESAVATSSLLVTERPAAAGDRNWSTADVGLPGSRGLTNHPATLPEILDADADAEVNAADAELAEGREPAQVSELTGTPEPTDTPELTETPELAEVPGASFAEIPVAAIRPNPRQPRTVFDDDALAELASSIGIVGVLQPVVVRRVDDPAGGQAYELVMGERRWRASQAAGLQTIPAIIRVTGDDALLRDALLENLHRANLNPLEEAAAYEQLLSDFGCTHEDLAGRLGRSRSQVSNTIRLLKLPPLVQRRVAAGVLSAGHARALLGLADAAAAERLAQRIVAEGLSVRATEEIVALGGDSGAPGRPRTTTRAPATGALAEIASRLSDVLETRVSVAMGRRRGRLTVEFADEADLQRILAVLVPGDVAPAATG